MGVRVSKIWKLVANIRVYRRLEGPPRGYVPICVGINEDSRRRFMVHTTILEDADFCELLYRSAEEYGFQKDGVLRIKFEAQDFEEWMITRPKHKIRKVKPI